jgi:ribosomal protein S18 acetylase RimI-like enzyme
MNALIELAKEKKLKKLQLTSSPKREVARALYKSLGFELIDTGVFILNI